MSPFSQASKILRKQEAKTTSESTKVKQAIIKMRKNENKICTLCGVKGINIVSSELNKAPNTLIKKQSGEDWRRERENVKAQKKDKCCTSGLREQERCF